MEVQIKEFLIVFFVGIKGVDGVVIVCEMVKFDDFVVVGWEMLYLQLLYFLECWSYVKVEMFLGGVSDILVGICGGCVGRKFGL